jgi:hypothetical protein
MIAVMYGHVTPTTHRETLAEYLKEEGRAGTTQARTPHTPAASPPERLILIPQFPEGLYPRAPTTFLYSVLGLLDLEQLGD